VRVLGEDRAAREALVASIAQATDATSVQQIGKILVLYRPRPHEEEKPRRTRPRRKPRRRMKRSYQS
jgi:RNA-binding protein